MRYHRLTEEELRILLETYQETQSVAETAQRLGWGQPRIRYRLKQHGVQLSGLRGSAVSRNRGLILKMYAKGYSQVKIAKAIGTNTCHVRAFLQERGLPTTFDMSGANNSNWRGGRCSDKDGYILVHMPDHPNCDRHGYMREHRLVLEKHLDRYLTRREVVHHIDGDRQNNDIANLRLYGSNADHLRASLTGKVPNWTEEGKRRILEGIRRSAEMRRKSNHPQSELGADQLQQATFLKTT